MTPGARLGPYEVTAQIGVGGMGEVRLARFEREAKTLASLNHPNIAHIYGLEKTHGVRALVMELVEGPNLAERIAQGIIHRDLKPANIKLRRLWRTAPVLAKRALIHFNRPEERKP